MDLDVDHYSRQELIELLGLDVVTKDTIMEAIRQKITEYPSKKSVSFFREIEAKLLEETNTEEVSQTVQVDVKRGTINPDLKQTVTRLINVDSAYRIGSATNTSDDFIFQLSEPLLNVVSIALYSLEVPQSWYTFTAAKGTVSFILCIIFSETTTKYTITIDEGNYTTVSLYTEVLSKINAELTGILTATAVFNANTGKLTLKFTPLVPLYTVQLIWVDDAILPNNRFNANLGWLLGYRKSIVNCTKEDNTEVRVAIAESLVDVSGTKYVLLSLDDFKTNRINRSIVSINNTPNTPLSMPTYFTQDVPQYRTSSTTVQAINTNRNLTSKQIYTINAISDQSITHNAILPYDSSNSFARISVKRTDWAKTKVDGTTEAIDGIPGKLFVENGGPLSLQMREYFGPVNITNLSIALYDDKGNLLGLNGMDWSVSLMVKCIYQY
jgi:serine/threonine protein kinase